MFCFDCVFVILQHFKRPTGALFFMVIPQEMSHTLAGDNAHDGHHHQPNHARDQTGMDKPRKTHSTLAHSPEPVSTCLTTSAKGKALSKNSRPGPQDGTLSGGKWVSHTWRAAMPAPTSPRKGREGGVHQARFVSGGVQGTDQKPNSHGRECNTLENAQRTRLQAPLKLRKKGQNQSRPRTPHNPPRTFFA